MGRGPLLKTLVKKEKYLTKARLQATKEWEERTSNFTYLAKKEIIDLLKKIDPLKLMAWGSTTALIYVLLEKSTEVMTRLEAQQYEMPDIYKGFPELVKKWEEERKDPSMFTSAFDILRPFFGKPVLLALSMTLAYLVVEHGGEIIGGLTGLKALALGLLG